jgi:NAD+ synthase
MQLTPNTLKINPKETTKKITTFIKDYVAKTHKNGIVLGISGGIDSATTTTLITKALGKNKTHAIYMPEKQTQNKTDHNHIKQLQKQQGFNLTTINITKTLTTLHKTIPTHNPKNKLANGYLKARTRMTILYYHANNQNLLVATSSDKSETMIGYYTKWGDNAADIAPIQDLYKTQVQQLATHLDIPKAIINKPPTPNLWPNQTAQQEIGLNYQTLDLILYALEHFTPTETIAKQLNLPTKTVTAIKNRWLQNEHKRKMPLTTKLQYRTINHDFRLPQTTETE